MLGVNICVSRNNQTTTQSKDNQKQATKRKKNTQSQCDVFTILMRVVLCLSIFVFDINFPNMCYVVSVKLQIETVIINTIVKICMAQTENELH